MKKQNFILLLAVGVTTSLVVGVLLFTMSPKKPVPNNLEIKKSKFLTEAHFRENLKNQLEWTPKTISELRKYNIKKEDSVEILYYYYTNDSLKAQNLASQLLKYNYQVAIEKDIIDKGQFEISGKTLPILAKGEVLIPWTRMMCEVGYNFDCDFDGWEVNVDSSETQNDK